MPETFDLCVKVGASGEAAQKVTTVQFDDGYKSKMSRGMNNETSEWNVSMTGSKKEIKPFVDFLRRHQGAISFYWSPPFEEKGLFTAEGWKTDTHGAGNYTVSTKFERLYAAGTNGELPPDAKPIYTINSNGPNDNGNINLNATGVGADPAGTANNAIQSLKEEINPFKQYALKSDIPDTSAISNRLDNVDTKISNIETNIDDLKKDLSTANIALGGLQGTVNGHQAALITINSNVATHSTEIAALKINVNTLNSNVTDLQNKQVKTVNNVSPDENGNIQLEINTGTEIDDSLTVSNKTWSSIKINNISKDFSNKTDANKGAGLVAFNSELNYPVETAGNKIKELADWKNKKRFTIIYPNGGTAEKPSNATNDTRYVLDNPFPNEPVICIAEAFYNNIWGATGWFSSGGGYGISVIQTSDDKLIIQTGANYVVGASSYAGNAFNNNALTLKTAPFRIKVWRII